MYNHKFVPVGPDRMGALLGWVDYAAYQAKVGDVANRLTLQQITRALRPLDAKEPALAATAAVPSGRAVRRGARKTRMLSAAGKARVDLELKMLAAIAPSRRAEFVKELADHARKYPSSSRYLRALADGGVAVAGEIVARLGGER